MSLRDGSMKMSKSDPSDMSRISLTDDDDAIAQKIRKAKTDPEPLPELASDLAGRPEAANLVGIYGALTGRATDSICAEYAGQGFGAFRSEEHTSELQSLMRISYAVFCLKKKKTTITKHDNQIHKL